MQMHGGSCATCHGGVGADHQAVYDDAYGPSDYAITINNIASVVNVGGGFDLTIDFSIDYLGQPYLQDAAGEAPSVGLGFRPVEYDGTEFVQVGPSPFPSISTANAVSTGGGGYTLTTNVPYDVGAFNSGAIVGAVYVGAFSFPDNPYTGGGSVQAYSDVAFDAVQVGLNAFALESPADVNGCVRCHGAPYRKHGNIQADVTGAPVFAQCKTCHFDNRVGGHEEWQYMVDDPENWATGGRTDADIEAAYAYTANLMNVTHMSHAMELPYPMTMANCATCHTGAKLADVLDNSNFTAQTCKSCHVVDGVNAWPALDANTPAETYAQTHRAPPLKYLWAKANVEVVHNFADINTVDCNQ